MTSPNDKRVKLWGSGYKYLDRKHRELGAFTCGYHAVVERDGVVVYPRHPAEAGNHCPGINDRSFGICLIGGLSADRTTAESNYTPDQWSALVQVVDAAKRMNPEARVVGHYEVAARRVINNNEVGALLVAHKTLCPSFDVGRWWANIQHRSQTKESHDASQLPMPTGPGSPQDPQPAHS